MKQFTSLLVALACAGVIGCAPAQTQSIHLLRPGSTVTGLDGVQVSAPPQWREGPDEGVQVTITRMDGGKLEWPLDPQLTLGLPIYRVQTDQPVLTGNNEWFMVSLPTAGADPAFLFGERLSSVTVDSDGPGGSFTVWNSDDQATLKGWFLTFRTTGFVDDTHLFTASLLNEPRTLP